MIKNKLYVYGEDDVKIPGHVHFGYHMLQRCKEYENKMALLDADTGASMSFRELGEMAVDVSLSLTHIGVKTGDIVAIFSENRMEYMPTVFGISCTGATVLSVEYRYGKEQLESIKPKFIFCSPDAYDILKELLNKATYIDQIIMFGDDTKPGTTSFKDFLSQHTAIEEFYPAPVKGWEDHAVILYTSGTTGKPKPVVFTHWKFLLCFINSVVLEMIPLLGINKILSTREWCYSFGLKHSLSLMDAGVAIVFTRQCTTDNMLHVIDKYKLNVIQLVPTLMYEMLKNQAYDLSSLEYIASSSIRIDEALTEAIKKRCPNVKIVSQFYGMSECGTLTADIGIKPGSVGQACSGVVLKIVDVTTGEVLGPNQRGEIYLKTNALSGYVGEAGVQLFDEEGFFKSGDIGYYDEDKYIYVVDRVQHMIKYQGAMVSPAEIESVLLMHPAVRDVAVTGAWLAKPDVTEVPVACVVKQPGATVSVDELVKYVEEKMPTLTLAGGVRFTESIPRGTGTKVKRGALRDMLQIA